MICKTELRKKSLYSAIYVFWSKVIFKELIPYTLLIALNGCIIHVIFKSQSLRKKHSAIPVKNLGLTPSIGDRRDTVSPLLKKPVKKSSVRSRIFVRDVITGKFLVRPLRVKVSENLGATRVAPVAPADTSLFVTPVKKGIHFD